MAFRTIMLALLSMPFLAGQAFACENLETCVQRAGEKTRVDVYVDVCAEGGRHFCLIRLAPGRRDTIDLAPGMRIAATGDSRILYYLVDSARDEERAASTEALYLSDLRDGLPPRPEDGSNGPPRAGMTLEVIFFVERGTEAESRALASLGSFHTDRPQLSIGVREGKVVVGRSRGTDDPSSDPLYWLPMWDPVSVRAGWNAIYLTLQADGKARVDAFSQSVDDEFRWDQSLLDTGWPIAQFPVGSHPKTYSPIDYVVLGHAVAGQSRAARRERTWATANGFARLRLFHGALDLPQSLASAVRFLNAEPRVFRADALPCNTGARFNSRPIGQSYVHTPCGDFNSRLARQVSGRKGLAAETAPTYFMRWGASDRRVFASEWYGISPYPYLWEFQHVRNNYYYVTNVNGDRLTVERVNGDEVTRLIRPDAVPRTQQLWRLSTVIDESGEWITLRSAETGYLVGTNRLKADNMINVDQLWEGWGRWRTVPLALTSDQPLPPTIPGER